MNRSADMRVLGWLMNRTGLTLLLLASLTVSCNRALRDAMTRAEEAHGRGDHFGEAVALRDACAAAPDEQEICAVAKESANEVIGKQLEVAAGPCNTEPNACLAALEVLSPFATPDDARLLPYYDRAGAMLAERCGRAPLQSPEDAVFIVRCAEAYRQRVPTPAYANQVFELRQRSAAWLDQAASSYASSPGVAWVHEALAACLGGEAAWAPRVQKYRAAFDAAHGLKLVVTGQALVQPQALCARLRSEVSAALVCEGPAAGTLALHVDAWLDPMTDSPLHERRTVDVLDHTERWENPDYRYVQGAARAAKTRQADAYAVERVADTECSVAKVALEKAKNCTNCRERTREENSCARHKAAAEIERTARKELDEAQRVLSRTPATLTRDVYRTVSYRHTEHRFRQPWHVRVGVAGSALAETGGVLTYETTERDGVPGHVDFIAYSEPSPAERASRVAQGAFEVAAQAVSQELDRRAQARLAVCPAPNAWSDCQVEAALLKRTDPVAQFAADVGTKLDSKTAQPWPKAGCAP